MEEKLGILFFPPALRVLKVVAAGGGHYTYSKRTLSNTKYTHTLTVVCWNILIFFEAKLNILKESS
jgi:hypothetical protein